MFFEQLLYKGLILFINVTDYSAGAGSDTGSGAGSGTVSIVGCGSRAWAGSGTEVGSTVGSGSDGVVDVTGTGSDVELTVGSGSVVGVGSTELAELTGEKSGVDDVVGAGSDESGVELELGCGVDAGSDVGKTVAEEEAVLIELTVRSSRLLVL